MYSVFPFPISLRFLKRCTFLKKTKWQEFPLAAFNKIYKI